MLRATRSAVRWRVPVSHVGTLGFGTRWTLARAIRVASGARMMAPSIFASSLSRCGVNSASIRKPPRADLEHVGAVADDDQRAPCSPGGSGRDLPASGRPGATAASASMNATLLRRAAASLRIVVSASVRQSDEPRSVDGVGQRADAMEAQVRPAGRVPTWGRWPRRTRGGRLRRGGVACARPGAARRRGRPRRRRRACARSATPVIADARRERDGEVGSRLVDAHASDGGHVDVGAARR